MNRPVYPEILPAMEAFSAIAQDPSRLQNHPFIIPMSAGVQLCLDDKATRAGLVTLAEQRFDASELAKRNDTLAVMTNLIGHWAVFFMRTGPDQVGEENLRLLRADTKNPKNPLHSADTWKRVFADFLDYSASDSWLDVRNKSTQTTVAGRSRGIAYALKYLSYISENFRDQLRVLDFGGSLGFVSSDLLSWDSIDSNIGMINFPYSIEQAVVLDISDDTNLRNAARSWARSNSISLQEDTVEAVEAFEQNISQVLNLQDQGKLEFKRMVPGYDLAHIPLRLGAFKPNIIVLSTVLGQILPSDRQELFSVFREISGEEECAIIVNEFASVDKGELKIAENRWHGAKRRVFKRANLPYSTSIAFTRGAGDAPLFRELIRWPSSRCGIGEAHLANRQIEKALRD